MGLVKVFLVGETYIGTDGLRGNQTKNRGKVRRSTRTVADGDQTNLP